MPFASSAGLQGLRTSGPREDFDFIPGNPLLGFGSPSEETQAPSRCQDPKVSSWTDVRQNQTPCHSFSLEVSSPSAFPRLGQRLHRSSLPNSTTCAFRFSQPPGAFFRPKPAGPISCRIRPWGLPFRALFLPRSRTLSPAPIPSWRSNRLQGLSLRESPPPDLAV